MAKQQKRTSVSKTKAAAKEGSTNSIQRDPLVWILAAIAFLLFANTLGHGWVLDDYSAIKENFVTQRGLAGLGDIWSEHYRFGYWNSPGELYRPFVLTMFAIEWQISPDNPFIHHLINVLSFALLAVVIYKVLLKIVGTSYKYWIFAATLLFVAHPIHVEVVANIKSRDEIVAMLGCFLALGAWWNYLDDKRTKWLVFALFAYTIAMFSKENAITFLAIFPLAGWFFRKESIQNQWSWLSFAAPVVLYLMARKGAIGDVTGTEGISFLDNVILGAKDANHQWGTTFHMLGKYIWTLIFPHPLGSDFGFNEIPIQPMISIGAMAGLISWLVVGGLALWGTKERKIWAFGGWFLLINFSIFSNIFIHIGTSYGDRLMFLPSLGFVLLFVGLLQSYFSKTHTGFDSLSAFAKSNTPISILLGVICVLFSMKTISRNTVWDSSLSLYEADIQNAPNSAKLNFHYGLELTKMGLEVAKTPQEKASWASKGRATFEKAIAIYPEYHDAYSQLGLTYYREGNKPKALELYKKAIQYKSNFPLVYSNMGTLYFEMGDRASAIEAYKNAVKYDPRFVDARRNLGCFLAMDGKFDAAIEQFQEALKYKPEDPDILFFMGSAYRDKGDAGTGMPILEKAFSLKPSLRK